MIRRSLEAGEFGKRIYGPREHIAFAVCEADDFICFFIHFPCVLPMGQAALGSVGEPQPLRHVVPLITRWLKISQRQSIALRSCLSECPHL